MEIFAPGRASILMYRMRVPSPLGGVMNSNTSGYSG
nr:MAG TPA: hypothetical protein [Caudoviricetes sp.]